MFSREIEVPTERGDVGQFEDGVSESLREKMYSRVSWSPVEKIFIERYKFFTEGNGIYRYMCERSFSNALHYCLKNSSMGLFLEHLNEQDARHDFEAQRMKLDMLLMNFKFPIGRSYKLGFSDQEMPLIKQAIKNHERITCSLIHRYLKAMRLIMCGITTVDWDIGKFKKLQALSLSANWIEVLDGRVLPRTLKVIELFCNMIKDVSTLTKDLPTWMVHIGLGRNKLSDLSNLHLFAEGAANLRTIDLENNELCDLVGTLKALSGLRHLMGLQIEGNPCSTCMGYKETVLQYFPRLRYLDNVEVLHSDREVPDDWKPEDHVKKGVLLFTCYRLMGVPQPKREVVHGQEVKQTFHLELEFPLLDPVLRVPDTERKVRITEWWDRGEDEQNRSYGALSSNEASDIKDSANGKKEKIKEEKSASDKKSSKEKKSIIVVQDERLLGIIDRPEPGRKLTRFTTDRQTWAPIIEFPGLYKEVPAPDGDLVALRDTFRTNVKARVIYLRTLPPVQPGQKKDKKSKKGKQEKDKKGKEKKEKEKNEKGQKDKGKKGKGEKKSIKSNVATEDVPEPPPEETVLSKITLAKFDVPMQTVSWDEEAAFYRWSPIDTDTAVNEKEDLKSRVYEIPTNLPVKGEERSKKGGNKGIKEVSKNSKDKEKEDKKESKKETKSEKRMGSNKDKDSKNKGKEGKEKDKEVEEEEVDTKFYVPDVLTVHLGVGLKREEIPLDVLEKLEAEKQVKDKEKSKQGNKKKLKKLKK